MMVRLFHTIGADWDQFKTLLSVSVRIDFRGSWGGGGRRRKLSPIFRSLIFYGLMGGTLAVTLASRATPFLFSLLTLAYSMVMMAFAVILEFGNSIINPEDAEVLIHRPIHPRTYFLARLCNLLVYVGLMGTALCLFPSFLGMTVRGCGWTFPLVFFPVAMIANLATAFFVLLIYTGLLKVMRYHRFKDVLAYFQIGFTFVILFSYQLIPRVSRKFLLEGTDVSGDWLYITPPAWFAGGVQVLLGLNRSMDTSLALIAVVVPCFLILFSFRRISLQYAGLVANLQADAKPARKKKAHVLEDRRESSLTRLAGRILRYPEALAGFQLTSSMMKRDRSVKMGVYPAFGFPLAFLILAIVEKNITDPFVAESFPGAGGASFMVVFFIFFMIYFSLMAMITCRDWEASWLYNVAPIVSPGRFYQGVLMAVLIRLMIPFFTLFGIIYCTQIPVVHGVQYTISLFFFGLVAFAVGSFLVKEYPFSKKKERGERVQRFAFLLFITPFFVLTTIIQQVAYDSTFSWCATLVGLLILFFVFESMVVKRLDRVLRTREFFA